MSRTQRMLAAVLVAGTSLGAVAQWPAFDVVSVKRSSDPMRRMLRPVMGGVRPGGVWVATDAVVVGLIRYAYPGHGLAAQIVGAPDWARRDLFDVEARATPGATVDQLRLMVRAMLADRFRLAVRAERRNLPGYRLVRREGRIGEGLTTPTFDCDAYRAARARGETPAPDPSRQPYGDRLSCVSVVMPVLDHTRRIRGATTRLTGGSMTMADVAALLAREMGRPVADATSLTQVFDVELQFDTRGPGVEGDTGPSLQAAVREQLGLQLDEMTTPADVLIIERVEPPSPN